MCKEDKKQYFVQIGNKQVEVNQEVYLELYKDQLYEKNQQRKRRRNNILSFDAMNEENNDVYDFVPDMNSNTEEEAIHRATMHKIKEILKEIEDILGMKQSTLNKKKRKILKCLKEFLK